ncbi:bifunctional glycerol-3-phosphate/glycerone-phosphate O-acyltransferase SCT1 [Sugiyamaella lignohabitans]|uniref:Bifunctional glycerol-3-phosphate/glycerone-phosphate O-acyltransferase SCT1 n=1 Tax=Sugiyamaella lignohabitans TaxID=796027 RepID=A0A167DPI1_9ASCO|nr:bifunctional glycerol-3-phosphate/glycerone-phosphate O-acyltransferase SCT1 [Sugiyamaella lignohabitans]ANB13140.1 bifunctional glycerol-3-phosphate/glycerone-phosphate O-acyltransferase SCT1 [Sugiyamaella lignohabitans]
MTDKNEKAKTNSTPNPPPNWLYDLMLWIFTIIFDLFFRKILPRGAYRIPKKGAVIFVAAPHANQFVDPMMLMQQVKVSSGRRISFLVAEASTKRPFIGFMAWATNAIGVVRAQDNLVKGSGTIYMEESDPLKVLGKGTKFTQECEEAGHVGLPHGLGMNDIDKIISDTELTVRKEFKPKARDLLLKGTTYKVASRVNHSDMYHKVFRHLHDGNCLGIFPEGGSHDRPDLLPIKAGVAIMALGAIADNRDCNVKIVPCGMNYFHPHKFRSRAVIEFGEPVSVPAELVDMYLAGGDDKRKAVKSLLDDITVALKSVTITSPDYDTLMILQAARRLYLPKGKQVPLSLVVELTRRFTEGYNHYKDDPRIIHMREMVSAYNRQLSDLGIKDHQVETASLSPPTVIGKLIFRTGKLLVLLIFSLPGAILFAPVFVATKRISKKKAAEALKASSVKIAARDVLATWKLLVAMGLTPVLYTFYAFLATWLSYKYELVDRNWRSLVFVTIASYIVLPSVTFAALVIGETGMDIFKSLRPLALALNPSHKNTVAKLKQTKAQLSEEITELVNTLGPELYPDFEHDRIKQPLFRSDDRRASRRDRASSNASDWSMASSGDESAAISRVNSEFDLADIPLFSYGSSSGRTTPGSHSRTVSDTSSVEDLNDSVERATGSEAFNTEISKRIRGAMAERLSRGEHEN